MKVGFRKTSGVILSGAKKKAKQIANGYTFERTKFGTIVHAPSK